LAPPVRTQRPVRTLVTLGVIVVVLFGAILAGTMWSTATFAPKLALDLEGGTQIILTPVATDQSKITDATITQAIEVIRQRIDASGVSEAEITSQSGHKIVVALPGRPSEATLELVRKSAQMEFRPVLDIGSGAPAATASPTATSTGAATPAASATASPAASGSSGGNAVAGSSVAAAAGTGTTTDTATPTPTPSSSGSPVEPSSPSDAAYYVTPAVQAAFDALDCTKKENLTGGTVGPADVAFVTCDATGAYKYILGPVEVEGAHIAKASSGLQTLANGQTGTKWVVNLTFDGTGTKQFATSTTRLYKLTSPQNQFAIVLDGLVISAPSVNGVIPDGRAEISGSFTRDSAATLAQQLNFGSLPLTFTVESEQQISATLGSEQLAKGLLAGLIGLVLVVLYSLAQYRLLGLLTIGSLVIAAVLAYLTITLLSWTQGYRLSLPGVAGLIVAIGITADSFIVYFERIRDELRDGRALTVAVDHGWARARRTILASDAVNFLAAIVLYVLAVGGVRGFAFTLGLTTVIDLVVVFMFTHPMMMLIARTRFFSEGHALSGLDPRRLGVPGTRYVGRGRVADGPRVTGPAEPDESPEVGSAPPGPGTARLPVVAGGENMTIAERRAAAKAAAQAQASAPSTDGSED
jgi:preprotein translocase subunit SecD